MSRIDLGTEWLERPCAASNRRGYQRRVVVVRVPGLAVHNGRVLVRPAAGQQGNKSFILTQDFIRRFVQVQPS